MDRLVAYLIVAILSVGCSHVGTTPSPPPSSPPLARLPDPPLWPDTTMRRKPVVRGAVFPGSGPECYPGSEGVAPHFIAATMDDARLTGSGVGQLVIHVRRSRSDTNVVDAYASLIGRPYGATTDTSGLAVLSAVPGRYELSVRRIGYTRIKYSIDVRLGFADTVRIGLGASPICLTS